MTVWGISMVRDEADILPTVITHMRGQVDHLLVADNRSVDGSGDILRDLGVTVVDDPDPAYRQSDKMTALAARAAAAGATWVVPFDADEMWTAPGGHIGQWLATVTTPTATAALYDHVTTDLDDPTEPDPVARMRWRRRDPAQLPKVACRTGRGLRIAMGNHAASYADAAADTTRGLVVHHYPYRSREQFIRKAANGGAALAAADLPRSMGAHWRSYHRTLTDHGPDALVRHYDDHFHVTDPVAAGLVCDPVAA